MDEVIVDTDSDEIEEAVVGCVSSVSIHRRPERLHGDMVPMHDVVTEVARDVEHDHILQTHSTNPLLRSETVDAAYRGILEPGEHDSLMSVMPFHHGFTRDGAPVNHDPAVLLRTQDLPPVFEENSNIYISPPISSWRLASHRMRPFSSRYPSKEAVDIDEEFDFPLAGVLLERQWLSRSVSDQLPARLVGAGEV